MNCLRTFIFGLVVLVGTFAAAHAAPSDKSNKISACLDEAKGDAARERNCIDRMAGPCMQKPRNVWAHYILAVHKGKEGHWILVKGVKMCDTYTEGRWTFVVDGPHRGARIMEIFEVRKSLG